MWVSREPVEQTAARVVPAVAFPKLGVFLTNRGGALVEPPSA
jgi:hypothetical protein